jgi:hypothetical protein
VVDETQEYSEGSPSMTVTRAEVREWMSDFFDFGVSGYPKVDTVVGPHWKGLFCLSDGEWDAENNRILALLSQCRPLAIWLGETRNMLTEWYTFRTIKSFTDSEIRRSSRQKERAAQKQQSMRLATHRAMIEVLRDVLVGEDVQDPTPAPQELSKLNLVGVSAEKGNFVTDDALPPYPVIDPHCIRVKKARAREDGTPDKGTKRVKGC